MLIVHTMTIDSQHENYLESGVNGLIDDRDIIESSILGIQYEFFTKDEYDLYGDKTVKTFTRIIITVRED